MRTVLKNFSLQVFGSFSENFIHAILRNGTSYEILPRRSVEIAAGVPLLI